MRSNPYNAALPLSKFVENLVSIDMPLIGTENKIRKKSIHDGLLKLKEKIHVSQLF